MAELIPEIDEVIDEFLNLTPTKENFVSEINDFLNHYIYPRNYRRLNVGFHTDMPIFGSICAIINIDNCSESDEVQEKILRKFWDTASDLIDAVIFKRKMIVIASAF